ncbi:MAG: DHH family phosphoesterase [Eubacteriales bacterium]|nr:DHH family phosphoesterase [Eubacteriales bacterium]
MFKDSKLKRFRHLYDRWPVPFLIPLILATVLLYSADFRYGLVGTVVTIVYAAGLIAFARRRQMIIRMLQGEEAMHHDMVPRQLLDCMPQPYALLAENGDILRMNDAFEALIADEEKCHLNITAVLGGALNVTAGDAPDGTEHRFKYGERYFRAQFYHLNGGPTGPERLIVCFLTDQTDIRRLKRKNRDQRLVQGLIYIDNYEEVIHDLDDVRRALISSLVERRIRQYFMDINGIIQNFERDKYYVLIQHKYLNHLQSKKFDILEDVKTVNVGNDIPLTLSMGFGDYSAIYQESYESALAAVDLALARGGDQAVVRSKDKVYYYGGRSKTVEKNTRVKSRVKAHALRSVFKGREKIMVMGHRLADIDCVGAGIGVYTIARIMNKEVHIVLDEVISSVRPSVDRFLEDENYPPDMFISPDRAREIIGNDTTLVLVDVNKPAYTEAPDLIERAGQIVVIDHHRQGSDVVKNPVLSYVEPYASSTCEMITEILQYISDTKIRFDRKVVDALYSGILIDTNYFNNKVGVRTFEAAAFLRKNGADLDGIRKMLREDENRFKAKARTVAEAKTFREGFVIGSLDGNALASPTELGAQAANELLNISGVRASFVLTENAGIIYISARSIDEINVQIIMERLGGGGHQTVAGAQMQGVSPEEARQRVIDLVETMLAEGDL